MNEKNGEVKGYVYVICDNSRSMCKVGTSRNPKARVASVVTGAGVIDSSVVYFPTAGNPYSVEKKAHALLRSKHVNGEWFRCSAEEACEAVREAEKKVEACPHEKAKEDRSEEFFTSLRSAMEGHMRKAGLLTIAKAIYVGQWLDPAKHEPPKDGKNFLCWNWSIGGVSIVHWSERHGEFVCSESCLDMGVDLWMQIPIPYSPVYNFLSGTTAAEVV